MVDLFLFEYITALGMTMVLLFLDSRYPRRRTVGVTYAVTAAVMVAVAAVCRLFGLETAVRFYPLLAHLPALVLLFVFSRFRGWRLVFQLLSAVLFCLLVQHGAGLLFYLSGGLEWVRMSAYILLSAAVIVFLVRFLRPLFLRILLELQRGWWLMCLVMANYYILTIYLIPGYAGSEGSSTILKSAVSLLMVGFYTLVMFLFYTIRKEADSRRNAQLTALQLSALQSRMAAVQAEEDAIRTERHDLRHRLQTAGILVSRGDRDSAQALLGATLERLEDCAAIHWCRPPVLDAMFTSYFAQAKSQGIQVDASISLPAALPVDEGELAVALANALENAIHANMKLPPDKRSILCRVIGRPNLMLEISNPVASPVRFDEDGFPLSDRENHGLGVQSIRFFCEKNGAVCQYEMTDSLLSLRIIL